MKKYVSFMAIVLAGCAASMPSTGAKVGSGLTRIDSDLDHGIYSINEAMPFTSEPGKTSLKSGIFSLSDAKTQIPPTVAASEKIAQDDMKTHNELVAEQNHWIGYKTRLLAKWLIAISLAVWFTFGVLFIITQLSPIAWLTPIINEIANILPFWNPWVWIRDYLKNKKAKTA